jgi:hypothetical protein
MVRERPGDFLRVGADLVQGWVSDDVVLRAEAMVRVTGEDHACLLATVATFLAQTMAKVAGEAGEDLAPMLTEWRAAAARLDLAAGGPSPN